MGKDNKITLIVIQNYFKNIVFYYIILYKKEVSKWKIDMLVE